LFACNLTAGFVTIDDTCYATVAIKLNWLKAKDACKSLHTDAHLVAVSTAGKRTAVKALVAHLGSTCPTVYSAHNRNAPVQFCQRPFRQNVSPNPLSLPPSAFSQDPWVFNAYNSGYVTTVQM